MIKYRLTPAAKRDVQKIWAYTVEVWGKKKAQQYLSNIENKLNLLAVNPELGKKRPEIKKGYFSFPVEKHIISDLVNIIILVLLFWTFYLG